MPIVYLLLGTRREVCILCFMLICLCSGRNRSNSVQNAYHYYYCVVCNVFWAQSIEAYKRILLLLLCCVQCSLGAIDRSVQRTTRTDCCTACDVLCSRNRSKHFLSWNGMFARTRGWGRNNSLQRKLNECAFIQ